MSIRQFVLFLAGSLALAPVAMAQADAQPAVVRMTDGGGNGRMESIFVPPKAGAPFSLTLATEWTRPLGSTGTYTLANERHIVRDSKGRIYQERWILVPKGGKLKSWMDVFQITDPELHTWFNCITKTKVCDLYEYHRTTTEKFEPAIGTSGPLRDGSGFRQHEDLGLATVEGLDAHGYRETTTINAGVLGNDQAMVVMREFWFSPQLGFNLKSTVSSPDAGTQVFTVKELSTAEPEASFFEIPGDYKVVDRRSEQ